MTPRLLAVPALLAAIVAVALPAGADGATRGASSPTAAVRLHYRAIAQGRFSTAYALFTPAAKRRVGGFARWKAGYGQTGQVTISSVKRSGTTVRFTLTACRGEAAREVTIEERFAVRWRTRKTGGRYFLDADYTVRRRSSEEVQRCMLPIP